MAKPTITRPVQGSKRTNKKNEASVNAGTSVNLMKTAKSRTMFKKLLGTAKGNFIVPDDFNDPLPKEIEDLFYKGSVFPDVIK